jgi:adenylosuccinate lyase
MSREDAYAAVQRNAMRVWESDGALSLRTLLGNDDDVSQRLNATALDALFDDAHHFKHVDTIFARVFG